jgi:hypothetical protein
LQQGWLQRCTEGASRQWRRMRRRKCLCWRTGGWDNANDEYSPLNLPARDSSSSLLGGPPCDRTATLSVEMLRERDKHPLKLAWGLFLTYIAAGMAYFMALKKMHFRDALFNIINSLSAVSYGQFSPETGLERACSLVLLFYGVGLVGSLIGIVISR